jgi:tetratricopeptide (TPR) repeat protein
MNPRQQFVFLEKNPLSTFECSGRADALIQNLPLDEVEKRLLGAEVDLCRRSEKALARAKGVFEAQIRADPKSTRALLGLAKLGFVTGNRREAVTLLPQVLSAPPFYENFWLLEEAHLMMAVVDPEEPNLESLNHVIDLNQSCAKAWELRGHYFVIRRMFLDAAFALAQFWKLNNRSTIDMGYEYAVSLMKIGKWAEALSVSRRVLSLHPNYRDLEEKVVKVCFLELKNS